MSPTRTMTERNRGITMYTVLTKMNILGEDWILAKTVQTKYFRNGKACLHCETTYSVELADPNGTDIRQRFWIKNRAEARSYLTSLMLRPLNWVA